VRCFEDDDIVHVAGRIKPLDDIEVINTELALADLDTVERGLLRAEKAAKAGDKEAIRQRDLFGSLDAVYGDVSMRAAIRGINDLANRASVVVYGFDPTGPGEVTTAQTTGIDGMTLTADFSAASTFTSAALGSSQREARQNGLIDLAVPTGGIVWRDSFAFDRGLARILADQSGYYLVGYEPDAHTFARIGGAAPFHDVAVKVRRKGLSVRSRQGFYGVTDETIAESAPAM
jgi:VWFA-related protein